MMNLYCIGTESPSLLTSLARMSGIPQTLIDHTTPTTTGQVFFVLEDGRTMSGSPQDVPCYPVMDSRPI